MELLSLRQAAERLQCSPQTVRRHVDNGKLHGEKVRGKFGPEWRVNLECDPPLVDDRAQRLSRSELLDVIRHQVQVIDRLSHRLRFLGDCLINCPIQMACVKETAHQTARREGKPPEHYLVDLIAY